MPAIIDPFIDLSRHYMDYAALQQEVGSRLLERLEDHEDVPRSIACLGAGDGSLAAKLKKRYRKAKVVVLDRSPAMLSLVRSKSSFLRPLLMACSGIDALPLADRSVDLLFANLAGHWRHEGGPLMAGYRRVLRPGGLLLFSSLGLGSLGALSVTSGGLETDPGFPPFEDILRAGDQMMAAGFRDPVMDSDRITLTYPDFGALCRELEGAGMALEARRWASWKEAVANDPKAREQLCQDERFPVRYEVIYGAAFAPEDGQPLRGGGAEVATFSVDSLRKTLPGR